MINGFILIPGIIDGTRLDQGAIEEERYKINSSNIKIKC